MYGSFPARNWASHEDLDGILRSLVDQMEAPAEKPWRIDDMDGRFFENLKKAIVPFSITVSHVEAKFKLGQRRSDGDVAGLIRGLREAGSEKARLLADAMELLRSDAWEN